MNVKTVITTGIIFIASLLLPVSALGASDAFRNDYTVEYVIPPGPYTSEDVPVDVHFTITITNLKAREYVDRISLSFPDSFKIHDVIASDENGVVNPGISTERGKTQLTLAFNDPLHGINTKNTFNVRIRQEGLLRAEGAVYEIMMPTVTDTSSYQIIVTLPPDAKQKLSIAKPEPTNTQGNKYIWKNPEVRTIYALFGAEQAYDMKLTYHLRNTKLLPVAQEIALPPDTQYQKIFIKSLKPEPESVRRDTDGNLLAKYVLSSSSEKDIVFEGSVIVYTDPQNNGLKQQDHIVKQFHTELTAEVGHFDLHGVHPPDLSTPQDIYQYVTNTLKYNYDKVNESPVRLGAAAALARPTEAICTEYSDAFVGLMRRSGVPAREIQGYGFSQDSHLLPLSLVSDVLHSWPEYYDADNSIWRPVDPTWEHTSGIDYFSSFDINHITFAIHGIESDYPYPAGSYKFEDTKDVAVSVADTMPVERIKASVTNIEYQSRLFSNQKSKILITVRNEGSSYWWDEPISLSGSVVFPETQIITIPVLAPFEQTTLEIPVTVPDNHNRSKETITVGMFGEPIYQFSFEIIPEYYKLISYALLTMCLLLFGVTLLIVIRRLRKRPLPI